MAAAPTGGWSDFRSDLARRTRIPFAHVTFVIYFVASIVLIGGLGLWVELINYARSTGPGDLTSVRTAVATFFPALIGSTCLQVQIGKFQKQARAVSFLSMLIFAVVGFWLIFDRGLADCTVLAVGTLCSLFSLWFWWVANADNVDLYDDEPPNAATGGEDTGRPLGGDLTEFQA